MRRRSFHNNPLFLKGNKKSKAKLTSKGTNLLEFCGEEGSALLSKTTAQPLEGFTESVEKSISEYVSKATSDVEKGHFYLSWILTHIFQATEAEAEDAIIDGPNDCGIDAYYYPSENEIYLIQAKFGTSHSIEAIDHFFKSAERFKNSDQANIKRPELAYLWNNVNAKGVKIKLVYVTDQNVEYESNDALEVIGIKQTIQILAQQLKKPSKGEQSVIKFIDGFELNDAFTCAVSAIEIADLIKRHKHIFSLNIRDGLGHRNKINKGIMKTLEDCPENFYVYNNGLVITVDHYSKEKNNRMQLVSPIIVNGAQSAYAILDRALKTGNIGACVPVKIVKSPDEKQQRNITRYSNSQNAVRGKDHIALEDFWKSVRYQMETRSGYFFEIQTGSWDTKESSEKAKFRGDEIFNQYLPNNHKKRIISKDAIQDYVAYFKQNPTEAYQAVSKFLPRGSKYEQVFPDELKDDYRYFLFATLIRECAKSEFDYGPKHKHPFKRYATLLFLAVTGKLVHEHILKTKEEFIDDIDKLESLMKDTGLFKKILGLANKVVTQFLRSSDVTKELGKVNNSPHNLFSKSIYNDEMKKVIEHYISLESDEIDYIKKTISGL